MTLRVLVVEDDVLMRTTIERHLTRRGVAVMAVASVAQGRAAIAEHSFHALLVDINLPDGLGFEVVESYPPEKRPASIVMTASVSVDAAVNAMRTGATDFLSKPFTLAELDKALARVLSGHRREVALPVDASATAEWRRRFAPDILGDDPSLLRVFDVIQRIADTDCPIIVQGETGTGKELIARAIHEASGRGNRSFVAINCAAMPETLMESELFGHAKGAFTGATSSRLGRFAAAHGGTLLLDEIGELPLGMQAKLLRALQEKQITPIGETRAVPVDVRIVAATHRNLEEMVEQRLFREDLLYRLDVIRVELPALRERAADIRPLVEAFIRAANSRRMRHVDGVTQETMAVLATYPWPGNVRQLQNVVERMVLLRGQGMLCLDDLPERLRKHQPPPEAIATSSSRPSSKPPLLPVSGIDLRDAMEEYENALIRQALERTGWNKNRAAAMLSMNRTTLVEKLKKKGWTADEPREVEEAGD